VSVVRLSIRRRVGIQLQATPTECGLACLAMIMSHHGRATTIGQVRREIDAGRDGTNLKLLKVCAENNGFQVRAFRAQIADLSELPSPLLLTWVGSHYVVLESLSSQGASIIDPAEGRRIVPFPEFAASYSGVALSLRPSLALEPRKRPRLAFWHFIKPHLPHAGARFGGLLALGFLLTGVGAIPALLTRFVVDSLIPAGDADPVAAIAATSAMFLLAYLSASLLRSELILWLEKRLDASLMAGVLSHLLALPYRYFQQRSSGDLLVRLSSTSYVRDVLSGRLLTMLIDSVFVVAYLVFIAFQSTLYVGLIVALLAVQTATIVAFAAPARRQAEREMTEMSNSQSVLLETIRGVETVKGLGTEDQSYGRWSTSFARQLDASVRRTRLDNTLSNVLDAVSFMTPVALLLLGAVMVVQGRLSLGTMLALNGLAAAALVPVRSIGANMQALQTVRVHLARLRDILDEEAEDTHPSGIAAELRGGITVHDVSFRYGDSSPPVLTHVSCQIAEREFVAIIGPSGSGKSTLARILLGLLTPSEGDVSFDQISIDHLNLKHLRRQCGMVTQESEAVSGSILANIISGRSEVTKEAARGAAHTADLLQDVNDMPMGFDTPLGESGIGLSGGQKQRLAIARAIAGAPKILLLDEATSHLDSPTEQRITENLERLPITRIVIAHRLSTIINADRIVMMRHGTVVLSGSHEELLEHDEYVSFIGDQMRSQAA